MITREPPPQLADLDRWSLPFHDFVAQSLQKVSPSDVSDDESSEPPTAWAVPLLGYLTALRTYKNGGKGIVIDALQEWQYNSYSGTMHKAL